MKRLLTYAAAALFATGSSLGAQSTPGGNVLVQAGFGRAVAIAGTDVLIGEPSTADKPGIVHVYRKTGANWTDAAALRAAAGTASDGFGGFIAANENQMLVGAQRANDNKGAAYVFVRDGRGNWTQQGMLVANDGASGEAYAGALAISGDLAVVAAPAQNKQTGAVYVFRRTGNNWRQEAKLLSPEPAEQEFFGQSVAIVGDRILVGEPGYNERAGTVNVFTRQNDAWTATGKLATTGVQLNERFGASMATDNNRVYVGVTGFQNSSGAVFVFAADAQGELRDAGRINAYYARAAEQFGSAIAADGYNIWIGAPRANGARGAVYHIWTPTGDTLATQADRLVMPNPSGGDFFGGAVAARGDVAVAASINDDFGLGSVIIYERNGATWTANPPLHRPDERIASITGKKVECNNGRAAAFDCSNVELMSYLSVPDIGGGRGIQLNDIWGWTDPETGKEWALIGRMDGTSFVDLSNPERPRYVGDLPMTPGANAAAWRDIKVYKNHAFIVADGSGAHGMQVFDLTRLRNVQKAQKFEPDLVYRNINSAHNIVINEETGFAYAVGASSGGETCGGGLHMVDIRDPKKPTFAGCFADPQTGRSNTGYSHDAQCVVYKGPDEQYKGREICLGSNETMLSIADVTDKQNPKAVSRASYPNVGYSHQGWLTEDQRFFYMNDELDELAGSTPNTRTIVWDLSDLDDPQVAAMYLSPTGATDHNLYIKGDTMYQSHYVAGLRIVDIADRRSPKEVGFFDTVPYGANTAGFGGSWSNYPYFKSGILIATSMNEGLFVLKKKEPAKPVL